MDDLYSSFETIRIFCRVTTIFCPLLAHSYQSSNSFVNWMN